MSRQTAHGLSAAALVFCEAYLANGFNGAGAYKKSHPRAADNTAATEAWKLLRNPKVKAYLEPRLAKYWEGLQMGGDEALGRLAQIARLDVRGFFDDNGVMLSPGDWPPELAACVKAFEEGKLRFESPIAAIRIILEVTGKLRSAGDAVDDLAEAILADKKQHGGARS